MILLILRVCKRSFYHNVESIGFDQNKIIILAFLKQFDYNRLLLIENSVVLVFSNV